MKCRRALGFAACIAIAITTDVANAAETQPYPTKTVRIVVPYTPGGGVDIMARILATKLSERLGQQFIVENRPGGGTIIGTEAVARSAPDGYTLLFANPALTATPALVDKVPYDTMKSFASLGMVGASFNVLVVHPSLPVKTVKELVALAKARPGELNYASAGTGSAIHLAMELFQSVSGIDVVHIAYKGASPAITDVLGGQVPLMFATTPPAVEHMRTGKLRALGVSSARRLAVLPTVPTIAESGYPGFEVSNWYAFVVPAQTPRAIVNRLNGEIVAILRLPDVKERITSLGNEIETRTPEQFDAQLRKELATWQKVLGKRKSKGAL
ncbi:MAG TPA: tripartite tricarboxylate transporter substrate binding protein [Burkholderiales bacterium]|nr:tripartite tricarboxylate transporter substrate binding protein [Burkholderiales bacterium]